MKKRTRQWGNGATELEFIFYLFFIALFTSQDVWADQTVSYPKIKSASFSSHVLVTNSQMPLALEMGKNSLVLVDPTRQSLLFTSPQSGGQQRESLLDTETPYSHSVCTARNVTIISFARRPVIHTIHVTGGPISPVVDFSRAFQTNQQALISDMAAATDCSVVYVLDGVHKKIFIVRPGQGEELFMTMTLLVEPTGLYLWQEAEELFIADWGGGSIYSVSVAFASPRVLRRVAGSGSQGFMVDTWAGAAAVLSGPTQFSGFEKGKILFTDRNPWLNTSAVRALHVVGANRGAVTTVSGGNWRGAGGSGLWGVAFNVETRDILFSEPMQGTVRLLSNVVFTYENCSDGETVTSGSISGECMECPASFFCSGGQKQLCPTDMFSEPGAASELDCWCVSGMYPVDGGLTCQTCPPNYYCPLLTEYAIPCAEGLVSDAGGVDNTSCYCMDGTVWRNSGCVKCPSGSYCANGVETPCPANSASYSGGTSLANCTCIGGYMPGTGSSFSCVRCASGMDCSPRAYIIEALGVVQAPAQFNLTELIDVNVVKRRVAEILLVPEWLILDNSELYVSRIADAVPTGRSSRRRILQMLEIYIWELLIRINAGAMDVDEVERYLSSLRFIFESGEVLGPILEEATGGVVNRDWIVVNASFAIFTLSSPENNTECSSASGRVLHSGICVCRLGYSPSGITTCAVCAAGKYSDSYTVGFGYACKECPAGLTTPGVGAVSAEDCVCPVGEKKVTNANGGVECEAANGGGGKEEEGGGEKEGGGTESNLWLFIGAGVGGVALLGLLVTCGAYSCMARPARGAEWERGVAETSTLFRYVETDTLQKSKKRGKSLLASVHFQPNRTLEWKNGVKGKRS
jgi:hypothetical protein